MVLGFSLSPRGFPRQAPRARLSQCARWRSAGLRSAGLRCAGFWVLAGMMSVVTTVHGAPRGSSAESHGEQVDEINQQLRAVWNDFQIKPSPPATDGEWCRRVFLDVLGRVPTVEELESFTSDKASDKKARLVNMLLHGEKYTEEYARNWTTIWTNVLIGRSGGTEDRTLTSREGMQKYLRDSFARNTPYDRMVNDLVAGTGTTTPGSEGFNGAVNFLVNKVNEEKATLATAATARIFLGLQVQCTQCHNHPFNPWKQEKFWQFNSFFRQTRALRRFRPGTRDVAFAELIDEDFAGEGNDPLRAEIFYETRSAEMVVALPAFIDGTTISSNSGYVSDVRRRDELSKLILQSEYLDQALVNRYWAHFLGYGFTKPIDDLGSHNLRSHPELLKYLGAQIREHSYDLKELIRWITLSEAYSLSSKATESNQLDDPALGKQPKFSHFYLRQMRAEELYESLVTATQAHKTRGSYEEQERAKANWLSQFVTAFGNDEGEEATTFNGTIPQALMMFNGDLIKDATSLDQGGFLWTVAASNSPPPKKINYLFQAGLARDASKDEVALANRFLVVHQGDVAKALQDIWWVILNSNEFILNH
jgi:hypothetical protein